MRKVSQAILTATVVGAIAIGCSGGDKNSQSNTTGGAAGNQASNEKLTGGGSTFINPIMTQWVAAYKAEGGATINYGSIGSGGGIKGLIDKTFDFAGSDAPMNEQETKDAGGTVLHLPVVIGAAAIAYNVDGVANGLKLNGKVLSEIFLGGVTTWNDPQIAALNPGVNLPNSPIFVAHRSDGSGTTYMFTDYLAKVSSDWKEKVGVGKSVKWPSVGLGAKGSEGVAGLLKTHKNSIAYVELTYALQNKISVASLQNASGKFVEPSADSASAAAVGVKMPDDLKVSLTNTSSPDGYPISSFSWIIVRQESAKGAELKKFLKWVLDKGQTKNKELNYGPVPTEVVSKEQTMIDSLK